MNHVNKYLRNFKPYSVASHKIWQVDKEERSKMLKLDWNEATIPPSPEVEKRLRQLLEGHFLNYYPAVHNQLLIESLSKYIEMPAENVQYFASSDSLHEYISKLFITVGDPVLILWPSYDNFRLTAEVAGARVMFYEYGDDFSFDKNRFENEVVVHEPSLVYICNPNNPLGTIFEKEYIEYLLKKYPETMFLIDEAYMEFSDQSAKEYALIYDNILISRTMSKAFGLANVRFGYLIASEKNINYISNIRNPKNITSFAQEAVLGALSDIGYMKAYVEEVKRARKYFIDAINHITPKYFKAYPSEGNFVLIRCIDEMTKKKLLKYLENNNIFVRNVNHSESVSDCIRVTIGTSVQMKRVVSFFETYKN